MKHEVFKHYSDCSATLRPSPGEKMYIIRVEQHTTALEHYSGGCPIPRAPSSYNGGQQVYAIIPIDVRVLSSHFTFIFPFQTAQSQVLSDLHPDG